MNRLKKEQLKKLKKETAGLSAQDLLKYNALKNLHAMQQEFIKKLHALLFPEAYEFMGDTIFEAKNRKRGINPVRNELVTEINGRRKLLNIVKLMDNGLEPDNSSLIFCKQLADSIEDNILEALLCSLDKVTSDNFWNTLNTTDISSAQIINQLKRYNDKYE